MDIKKLDFKSIYFDLYELNTGIYAAISAEKLPSSNAGFFDLGNHLIIFDTIMDPYATEDLIKASKLFTKKDPSFLINSHYHWDHLFGNRKFPIEIPIISCSETLSMYNKNFEDTLKRFRGIATQELKRIKEEVEKETNSDKILEMNNDIKTYNEILEPNFKLRSPDFIINDSIIIEGTENKVQIIYIGDAHTPGDMIAYFEKEKIVFMGDLLFEETDPNWATTSDPAPVPANPQRLCDTLINYMEKDIDIYIPGHGKISSKKILQENVEFFEKHFINK
ncbi:MAG: MBL fold metallo-hydrolase [Candidatus Lokiarchaeota archaeon]|nr:MBL fold metallo-hydrolase [Candidatus Lokiarchaeota archaeon]